MRDRLGVVAAVAQVLRERDEFLRHLLGQLLARLAGLELARRRFLRRRALASGALRAVLQLVERDSAWTCWTVLVQLVWISICSMSETISSGGFSSEPA